MNPLGGLWTLVKSGEKKAVAVQGDGRLLGMEWAGVALAVVLGFFGLRGAGWRRW